MRATTKKFVDGRRVYRSEGGRGGGRLLSSRHQLSLLLLMVGGRTTRGNKHEVSLLSSFLTVLIVRLSSLWHVASEARLEKKPVIGYFLVLLVRDSLPRLARLTETAAVWLRNLRVLVLLDDE